MNAHYKQINLLQRLDSYLKKSDSTLDGKVLPIKNMFKLLKDNNI
jgi:hypothetical protein